MDQFIFRVGISWTVAISIGWLISAICIIKKYERDKKICTVSDLIKLSFSGLTLWLVGAVFFTINYNNINNYSTLTDQLIPLSDINEAGVNIPPADPYRLAEYNSKVEEWISQAWLINMPLQSSEQFLPAILLVGRPEAPLVALCYINYQPDFSIRRSGMSIPEGFNFTTTPVRYRADCMEGDPPG